MTRKRLAILNFLSVECLEDRLCMSALGLDAPLTKPDSTTQAQITQRYGQLPLSFEANQGQTDAQVNFLSRGSGYSLFLGPTEAVLDLSQGSGAGDQGSADEVLRLRLVGSNPAAQPVGLDQLPGASNYLIGNDPSQWHTDIPNYGRVEYLNVYPGVNLVYYGNNQQHLEYDFVVAPGANPNAIRLSIQGAQGMTLDSQGNLVLHTSGGDVLENAPVLYQDTSGVRQQVAGQYVLEGNGQVGFRVGAYDSTRPLVIDPTYSLVYSTYLGGSNSTYGFGIAVDQYGDAYVTGWTGSNFPTTRNAFQARNPDRGTSYIQAFVTELNASGSGLVYSTYLGGSNGAAAGTGITVDQYGDAYVTGWTGATDFPTKNPFQPHYGGGSNDAFLTKLNPSGSGLLYSTYLGGSGAEYFTGGSTVRAGGIVVDSSGDAYLTGITNSANFPTTPGVMQPTPVSSHGAFVAKVNTLSAGTVSLVYSTYLETPGNAWATGTWTYGIAVDSAGDAYVTGNAAPNFPTTPNAYLANVSSGGGTIVNNGGFVAELNASGSALVYSTYLFDGSGLGKAIAVNSSGNICVAGQSSTMGGGFVMVLGPTPGSTTLLYSTIMGNNATSIALDTAGHMYVTGSTNGYNFTTVNAFQPTFGGSSSNSNNAFVAELDPSKTGIASIVYSSYLGGTGNDMGEGIAVDSTGNAYVVGYTGSPNFPTTPNTFQTRLRGTVDAFVTKIDPPAASMTISSSPMPGATPSAMGLSPAPSAPFDEDSFLARNTNNRWLDEGNSGVAMRATDVPSAFGRVGQDRRSLLPSDSRRTNASAAVDAVFAASKWMLSRGVDSRLLQAHEPLHGLVVMEHV
jgi:hypothetical protein